MSREPKVHSPIVAGFEDVIGAIANEQKPQVKTVQARPFLKWVGGKRSILPELLSRMPKKYATYYEPFLGGGALFFASQPKYGYLSDINFHLIITFQVVRDNPDDLIRKLKVHASRHSAEYYGKARDRLFKEKDPATIAALFIYLNKTCFNGLYRVNKAGKFNVPIGDYKNPTIVDEENIKNCSRVLQGVEIWQHGFGQLKPQRNDFYYLDPPYHKTYDGYNGAGFEDKEHAALADFCHKINAKGGYFMLSNSDTDLVRVLYKGYTIETVSASRSVSCKSAGRGKENELIIRNYK
jgi:DNA adenine methylase